MSAGKQVSIRDIAAAAGVSHSTVSRALHGRGRMSEATRTHILGLAEQLGYTPDAQARSLVSGETRTIGVVVTTIADPFVVQIVDGIEAVAQAAGYSLFLSASHAQPEREMTVVETFRQRRVDAVIITASRVGKLYSEHLQRFGVPIVLINNMQEGPYLYSISADDVTGAQMATTHLLGLGHRRIAYIGSPSRAISSERRRRGYRLALQAQEIRPEAGLEVLPEGADDIAVGRAALTALLPLQPTAIFAYNDLTAIGVLLAARDLGIAIPTQLSLVGFDDIDAAAFVTPPLTTVQQPRRAMGEAAMTMVLKLLAGEEASDQRLPCTFIPRATTAPPPAT